MAKNVAALEITSKAIKIIVGYDLDNSIDVIYALQRPLDGMISSGSVVNVEALGELLKQLSFIEDEGAKLRINISDVILALPPIGLNIYENDQTTNVVSPIGKVDKIDLSNVMSLVKKVKVKPEDEIVDIIPLYYKLDNSRIFNDSPLGETANSISVHAYIHTLPKSLVSGYKEALRLAGLKIKRLVVAPTALCEYLSFKSDFQKQRAFVLVDMGARLTSVSLIGDFKPISCQLLYCGGETLTRSICDKFHILFEDAEKLKMFYGDDKRQTSLEYSIITGKDDGGLPKEYYQVDLNSVIDSFILDYSKQIETCIQTFCKEYKIVADSLPIYISGGGIKLNGLLDSLHRIYPKRDIEVVPNTSIGARGSEFTNCIALIKSANRYHFTLEDDRLKTISLSRIGETEDEKKKRRKKNKNIEDDEL